MHKQQHLDNYHLRQINRLFAIILVLLILSVSFAATSLIWTANQQPNQHYAEENIVIIEGSKSGHFMIAGSINTEPVEFLLDTGATYVTIPQHIAQKLDIKQLDAKRAYTANGIITVYSGVIKQVDIGPITLYDIPAVINPHMHTKQILLGMSALKQIEFRHKNNQLFLQHSPSL